MSERDYAGNSWRLTMAGEPPKSSLELRSEDHDFGSIHDPDTAHAVARYRDAAPEGIGGGLQGLDATDINIVNSGNHDAAIMSRSMIDTNKLTPRAKRRAAGDQTSPIQSLDRGLIILEAVARASGPVSLADLTELLGVHLSSTSRLASTLRRRGFLACPAGRKDYVLGPSIWRLSREYNWGKMLVMVSHDNLKMLGRKTGETAHLAVRQGKQGLFIDHVATNHMIAIAGQTGETVPMYCTAHGKALLADFDERQLRALYGPGPLRSYTESTIVSIDDLAVECASIQARGFATDDGEYQRGVRCVAAPIRDGKGILVGSIGISAPVARVPEPHFEACIRAAVDAARRISELLSQQENGQPGRRTKRRSVLQEG